MGMHAYLEQIPSEQLTAFVKHPESAYEYYLDNLYDGAARAIPKLMKHLEEARARKDLPSEAKARIEEGIEQYEALLERFQRPNNETPAAGKLERRRFSLEKDWHVLHYALNGTAEPGETWLSKAILGGREIPDRDGVMGYGPLRYLQPQEVEAVVAELAAVDPQSLCSRLDHRDAEKKRIYLAHTLDDANEWEYLPQLFEGFRDFYADAAHRGNGMLLSIT